MQQVSLPRTQSGKVKFPGISLKAIQPYPQYGGYPPQYPPYYQQPAPGYQQYQPPYQAPSYNHPQFYGQPQPGYQQQYQPYQINQPYQPGNPYQGGQPYQNVQSPNPSVSNVPQAESHSNLQNPSQELISNVL